MTSFLYVALGGAIGASARHGLSMIIGRTLGSAFPYGTMMVNILGGFLMGLLVGWLALRISGGENLRLFLGVGVLGGFTTFSAFSLDAMLMIERKSYAALMSYMSASVIISILALCVGLAIARRIFVL